MITFPKYKFVGEILSAPADVVAPPLAVRDSVTVGFDAFDVNDTVPVTAPFACGLNVIVRGTLLPGATFIGNWLFGILNSGLSTEAPETIRFPPAASPVLES